MSWFVDFFILTPRTAITHNTRKLSKDYRLQVVPLSIGLKGSFKILSTMQYLENLDLRGHKEITPLIIPYLDTGFPSLKQFYNQGTKNSIVNVRLDVLQ